MRLLGVAPLPQNLARGLAHGDEELVIAEGLDDAGQQHEVAVGDNVEAEEVILREHVDAGLATAIVEGLLPDGQLGRLGIGRGGWHDG